MAWRKAEALCAVFATDTTSKTMQEIQTPETRGEICNLGGGGLVLGALQLEACEPDRLCLSAEESD